MMQRTWHSNKCENIIPTQVRPLFKSYSVHVTHWPNSKHNYRTTASMQPIPTQQLSCVRANPSPKTSFGSECSGNSTAVQMCVCDARFTVWIQFRIDNHKTDMIKNYQGDDDDQFCCKTISLWNSGQQKEILFQNLWPIFNNIWPI